MRLLRRALDAGPREIWLVMAATAELIRASVDLRVRGWDRVGPPLVYLSGTHDPQAVAEVTQAVRRADSLVPWPTTCLRQVLASQRMLRRRGCQSTIKFRLPAAVDASGHAWIEPA